MNVFFSSQPRHMSSTPGPGDEVEINYFFKSMKSGSVDIRENFLFTLGKDELMAPIEKAIAQMKVGEKRDIKVVIKDHFKSSHQAMIAGLDYDDEFEGEIELLSFTNTTDKAKHTMMSQSEFNQIALQKKELGNAALKSGDVQNAIDNYNQAIDVYQAAGEWEACGFLDERNSVAIACNLNLAHCYLQRSEFSKAIDSATRALAIDPKSIKGLYRRALAYLRFGEYEKARVDCLKGAKLEPLNRELRSLLDEIKKKIAESDVLDVARFSRFWSSSVPSTLVDPSLQLAWFEFAIDDLTIGAITVVLFTDIVPTTCLNLCRHIEAGHYEKCLVHKLIPGYVLQTGDFEHGDGSGGYGLVEGCVAEVFDGKQTRPISSSSEKVTLIPNEERFQGISDSDPYDPDNPLHVEISDRQVLETYPEDYQVRLKKQFFKDESFKAGSHDQRGVLSMANHGPDTNGSQFFLTLGEARDLDGKHVVFGKVVEGLEVLHACEAVGNDEYSKPLKELRILRAGLGKKKGE